MWSCMQPALSAFLRERRCPKILSSAQPNSLCRPWRCWIEMVFTARLGFIPLPASMGCAPILEQKSQYPVWEDGLHHLHGCHISMCRNLLVFRCYVLRAPGI